MTLAQKWTAENARHAAALTELLKQAIVAGQGYSERASVLLGISRQAVAARLSSEPIIRALAADLRRADGYRGAGPPPRPGVRKQGCTPHRKSLQIAELGCANKVAPITTR